MVLILFISIIATGCGNTTQITQSQEGLEEIIVTDLAGREVILKGPIEKAVINWSGSGGAFMTMAALLGEDVADYIAGWGNSLPQYRYDMYEQYLEAVPGLADIVDIGNVDSDDFNTEKVIQLNPDVVILTLQVKEQAEESALPALEAAGIPIVFIDYHAQTIVNHTKTTALLGKIFNQEERANEIIDFYTTKMNEVNNRLSKTDKEKPSVYIEVGINGPEEYGNSYGDSFMWGALAKESRGRSIGAGIINTSEPINPEYLLRENPDYIIMTGSYWPANPSSLRLGFLSTEEGSQDFLKSFTKRSGWETLKAVQNKNVYAIHHGLGREMYDCAATEFFAKVFYPQEFADIDPMATLQEYYDRFLPFELSGVWMMQLK